MHPDPNGPNLSSRYPIQCSLASLAEMALRYSLNHRLKRFTCCLDYTAEFLFLLQKSLNSYSCLLFVVQSIAFSKSVDNSRPCDVYIPSNWSFSFLTSDIRTINRSQMLFIGRERNGWWKRCSGCICNLIKYLSVLYSFDRRQTANIIVKISQFKKHIRTTMATSQAKIKK